MGAITHSTRGQHIRPRLLLRPCHRHKTQQPGEQSNAAEEIHDGGQLCRGNSAHRRVFLPTPGLARNATGAGGPRKNVNQDATLRQIRDRISGTCILRIDVRRGSTWPAYGDSWSHSYHLYHGFHGKTAAGKLVACDFVRQAMYARHSSKGQPVRLRGG